jgi:hypothetical protein
MKSKLLIFEISVGLILSYWVITRYFSGDRKFEELALGTETTPYQALDKQKKLIHVLHVNGEEDEELFKAWQKRGKKSVILFFGNSQTHSINQMMHGEVNYIEMLFNDNPDSLRKDILCVSLPNAGMQEFYLAYHYWKGRLPIDRVVVPVFMDDMREDGIRDVFFSKLIREKYQLTDTLNDLSRRINSSLKSYWSTNPNSKIEVKNDDVAALRETYQEKSEAFLNDLLEKNSLAWLNRQNVRGEFFNWLYRLRNTVFAIKANTVRKMIPYRYDLNMQALHLLVLDCVKDGKKMHVYIPPIRSDVPLPYESEQYKRFKEEIKNFSLISQDLIHYKNFESIIPGELWGYKTATNLSGDKEVDFMHFKFKGHQILADSLQMELGQLN